MASPDSIQTHSAELKKELGLGDLILTQILYVVGSHWVGTAAKLGSSQIVFWMLAVVWFYVPLTAVVIYLNRVMPLEGGLYQWAKLGFNNFVGFLVGWIQLLNYTATVNGGIVGAGSFKVVVVRRKGRRVRRYTYTDAKGNNWSIGTIKRKDRVTATALSPGSWVATGNPCPQSIPGGC